LFGNLFFNAERYDLSAVGRMKFNRVLAQGDHWLWYSVRPQVLQHALGRNSKRLVAKYGETSDILDVLKVLIDIRNGNGQWTISTIWVTAASVASVRWPRTAFRVGLVRVERAVKNASRLPKPSR